MHHVPVHPPVPTCCLERDLADLPEEALLVDGRVAVYAAEARQLPAVLTEIGRLRELTFRAIGEGTGLALDLDHHDPWYVHIFGWDRRLKRVVGAYRVGHIDRLLATRGPRGVYLSTLFRFSSDFFLRLPPALELGRSFVRAEYQRSTSGLPLLWKGLGRYIAARPQVRRLMGPVSMDRNYRDESLHLLAGHLLTHHLDGEAAERVRGYRPFEAHDAVARAWRAEGAVAPDLASVERRIQQLEPDGRGMPVLVRQYLKLGARVVELNVDPDFSDVVDALILLDLGAVEPRRLERFMGKAEAAAWQAGGRTPTPRAA